MQAAFELPAPIQLDIHQILIASIDAIVGGIGEKRLLNVMNMFHAAVAPEIRTPHDAARYTNALPSAAWNGSGGLGSTTRSMTACGART